MDIGEVLYDGVEDAIIDNVKVHIYGKKQTKPNRKWVTLPFLTQI